MKQTFDEETKSLLFRLYSRILGIIERREGNLAGIECVLCDGEIVG